MFNVKLSRNCIRKFCSQQKGFQLKTSPTVLKPSKILTTSQTPSIENIFMSGVRRIVEMVETTSRVRQIFLCSVIFSWTFGDYLDRKFLEAEDEDKIYSFIQGSSDENIRENVRTGDIVLFEENILSFNIFNILEKSTKQFISDDSWNHCGIVILNEHESNLPYILEIDTKRKKGYKITEYDKRILSSKEPDIILRQVKRTGFFADELIKNQRKLSNWVDCKINGLNDDESDHEIKKKDFEEFENYLNSLNLKRDSLWSLILTLWLPGENTIRIRSHIKELERKIKLSEYEIVTQMNRREQAPKTSGVNFNIMQQSRVKNTDELIQETRQNKLRMQLKKDILKEKSKKVNQNRKLNSSKMVCDVWRYLGLWEEDGAFSSELKIDHLVDPMIDVPLRGHSLLGPITHVKTSFEKKKINVGDRDMALKPKT